MRRDKTPLSAYETLCSLPSPPEILITEAIELQPAVDTTIRTVAFLHFFVVVVGPG